MAMCLRKVRIPDYTAPMATQEPVSDASPSTTFPQSMASREHITRRLRDCGIPVTHQRVEIASMLYACAEHVTAEMLFRRVNRKQPETSRATVYNTLRLLCRHGLVREVIVEPGKVFYDPNTTAHHHYYDAEHGELIDLPADQVGIIGLPPLPPGMVAEAVEIIVRVRRTPAAPSA